MAVILRQFGADIDVGGRSLVEAENPNGETVVDEDWVEMNSGCVCCCPRASSDHRRFAGAARGERVEVRLHLARDHWVGGPGPVAQELWVDDELLEEDSAVLDAVVTLVDASNVTRQLRETRRRVCKSHSPTRSC